MTHETTELRRLVEAQTMQDKLLRARMWLGTEPNAPKHFTKHGNEQAREDLRSILTRMERMEAALKDARGYCEAMDAFEIVDIIDRSLSETTIKGE